MKSAQLQRFDFVLTTLCLGAISMLYSSPLNAQVVRQDGGVFFAGQAVANPRGALSLSTNPAGLGELRAGEGRLQLSSGGEPVGGMRGAGWGLFGSLPAGPLSMALSLEQTNDTLDGAKTRAGLFERGRLSLGLGGRVGDHLHIGLATRWHALPQLDARWVQSWDAGVLLRMWSWLSLGIRVSGMSSDNTTLSRGAEAIRTRYAWGWAVRPFAGSDRLTWALDFEWPTTDLMGSITTSLSSRIIDGLTLRLEYRSYKHHNGPSRPSDVDSRLSLGLELGLGHWGADVALRADNSAISQRSGGGVQIGARFSGDLPHSLFSPSPRAVLVHLRGPLSEEPATGQTHFAKLLLDLHAIKDDSAIEVVALRAEGFKATWPQIEELRRAVRALRGAQKRVVFYADGMGNRGLALAAACEKIAMPAAGSLMAQGISAHFIGLKGTLKQIGVAFEVVRFGEHKNAPESLTRRTISANQRATLRHLVQYRWRHFVNAVALGRGVTSTQVAAALERGVVYPEDARAEGLIDAVVEPQDLHKKLVTWGILKEDERLRPYRRVHHRRKTWGSQPRLAVVSVTGTIVDGQSGEGLTGHQVGGGEIAKVLRQLKRRNEVKGIVARIDSGGGAVRGSDVMYQALQKLSKDKPTVASLGGLAASGGYWTALGARQILADAGTITGSIGIFTLKPNLGGLSRKIDLGVEALGIGPHWTTMSIHKGWTPVERAFVQRSLKRYYGLFLQRTSLHRKIPRPRLLTLAEGRIFTGDVAQKNGLVDEIGGLWESLELVRKQAGLRGEEDVRIEFWPQPSTRTQLLRLVGLAQTTQTAPMNKLASAVAQAAGPWLDQATLAAVLGTGTPLAVVPLRLSEPAP